MKTSNTLLLTKKSLPKLFYLMLFLFCNMVFGQAANHVVISEVAPMGGSSSTYNTGEYIELYNPFSTNVTFGPNVVITSGEASGSNNAAWTLSLSGKVIKGYGFLLIGDGGVSVTPDVSFPSNKNLANSGTRSYVQLKDGTTVIDAFGWDPTNVSSPNCEGTAFHPSSTSSDRKSFERKSGISATAHDTLGNAWDSNDNSMDFFENTSAEANPQNSSSPIEKNPYNISSTKGPGSVSLLPDMWKFNVPATLKFTLKSTSGSFVEGIKIVKPQLFTWNESSINSQPDTLVISQSGDTVTFTNFVLSGNDSVVISIPNVTCSDTTDEFEFSILTSSDGVSFYPIASQPSTLVYGLPRTAATVKSKLPNGTYVYLGKWVVMQGVVTVSNEFGGPSYLQDNTAGFSVYDSSVSNNVKLGDNVTVLGKVSPYYDLFELSPSSILGINSHNSYYDTLVVTIPQVKAQNQNGIEPYESRLLRINNIDKVLTTNNTPVSSWSVTGSGTNYNLISGNDTLQVRISPKTNLVNLAVPSGTFDIVGVLGQFINMYQIMPRSYDDIYIEGGAPRIISGVPYDSTMTPNSITFNFQTDIPGNTIVYFGKRNTYGSVVSNENKVKNHLITVSGLEPSTVYHVKLGTQNNGDTTYTNDYITETSSLHSSGTMYVFFNHSVDTSVSAGEDAQDVNIVQKLYNRIDSAQYSIDLALYSLSGSVGSNIATKLIQAKLRGVKIRVIGEYDHNGSLPWSTLSQNGIPVIFDNFDTQNTVDGLMHNKYFIFDNRDSTDTNDWVWTGSWNATDPGNNDDAQNVIEIQDKSLANAYELDFNEMWGSNSDTANAANSRFGPRKLDNTPHRFNIAGTIIEAYFDPADNTTSHIADALNASVYSIEVAMLTFTRNDLAQILVNKTNAGEKVHVIMDNNTDSNNQFNFLLNNGVDVLLKGSDVTGFFHHKYAIIDAEKSTADQTVITGSHNWSSAAEDKNDENTLIIHSKRIANLYLQEFKARYINAGGKGIISDVSEKTVTKVPSSFELKQNYPNPFNPSTTISFSIPQGNNVIIKVYNLLGQEVKTLVNQYEQPGIYSINFIANNLSSGIYFYSIRAGNYYKVKKMMLLK